ncbi:hypothetical protein D3C76_1776440 [compost metagenome]
MRIDFFDDLVTFSIFTDIDEGLFDLRSPICIPVCTNGNGIVRNRLSERQYTCIFKYSRIVFGYRVAGILENSCCINVTV